MQVGAKVMLGDRPVRVTLARCWAALSRWARIHFIFSLVWGGLFMGGEDLKAQVEQMKVRTASPLSFGEALYMLSWNIPQVPCLVNLFFQPVPLQCLNEALPASTQQGCELVLLSARLASRIHRCTAKAGFFTAILLLTCP